MAGVHPKTVFCCPCGGFSAAEKCEGFTCSTTAPHQEVYLISVTPNRGEVDVYPPLRGDLICLGSQLVYKAGSDNNFRPFRAKEISAGDYVLWCTSFSAMPYSETAHSEDDDADREKFTMKEVRYAARIDAKYMPIHYKSNIIVACYANGFLVAP